MILKRIQDFLSWKTGRKILVFESDDWGSLRFASANSSKYFNPGELDVYGHLDQFEGLEDLEALKHVLSNYTDRNGKHPILTANVAVANPDIFRIKAEGWNSYYYETSYETFKRLGKEEVWNLWLEMISCGFVKPQFHCREHLNISDFKKYFQSPNSVKSRVIFEMDHFGFKTNDNTSLKGNFQAAWDYTNEEGFNEVADSIKEGLDIFRKLYGFNSKTAIAPSYTWNRKIEKILADEGVLGLQGITRRKNPRGGRNLLLYNLRYTGRKNTFKQTNLVRNAFFEPSHSEAFGAEICLKRIEDAFEKGMPAIVGTHRVNFMGGANEENRDRNLEAFGGILKTLVYKYPEIEFRASDELIDLIND